MECTLQSIAGDYAVLAQSTTFILMQTACTDLYSNSGSWQYHGSIENAYNTDKSFMEIVIPASVLNGLNQSLDIMIEILDAEGNYYQLPMYYDPPGYTLTAQSGSNSSGNTAGSNGTELYYIHNDHLGTPQVLSNEYGETAWTANYDPFGQATINEDADGDGNSISFNLRFPGQYYDSETGLHYNYFRYYDPGTGRYITSDPIGLAGDLNTYAYVGNAPLTYIDPYGLERGGWYDLRTYLPQLPPHLQYREPGSGCGDVDYDCFVPDFYPEACRSHDQCYSDQNQSRLQCDNQFFTDMFNESGPQPNIIVPGLYWGAVRIWGGAAWSAVGTK